MKTITIPDLHDTLNSLGKDDLILDVRTPMEFAAGHIPKAKNIPVDQVMGHLNELTKFKTIYVYCKMGGRAEVACSILNASGIKNTLCVDDGGYPDWAAAGYPSEK